MYVLYVCVCVSFKMEDGQEGFSSVLRAGLLEGW